MKMVFCISFSFFHYYIPIMSKPINFSSSNNLISTRQPWVPNKNKIPKKANSKAIVGGMSRPNTNLGHNPIKI